RLRPRRLWRRWGVVHGPRSRRAATPLSRSPRRPPSSPLFPYTTLFRSRDLSAAPEELWAIIADPQTWDKWFTVHDRWLDQPPARSEEHTSELQSRENLVCRLLLEKKKAKKAKRATTRPLVLAGEADDCA